MAALLGIIQFIIIGYICVFEFEKRSASVFMWATLFIMFGVMHLLTSCIGDLEYSDGVLCEASIFVILFCSIYLLCRLSLSRTTIKAKYFFRTKIMKKSLNQEKDRMKWFFYLYVCIFVLKIVPFVRYAGNIFSTSWSVGRDYSATLGYANSAQLINIAFYSFAGVAAVLWLREDKKKFMISILLILSDVIITRNEILPFFCCLIALYLWKTNTIKFRTIIAAVLGAILVIYIVYGLRVFRHYGTIADFLTNATSAEFFAKINLYIRTGNGELGLLRDMYYFIDHGNAFEGFGRLHTYIRMIFVYIPTSFSFGIKPDDFAIAMGQATGMAAGGSTHPTLFGDCYANAGLFGIILGAFWAVYVTVVDRIIINRKITEIRILAFVLNAVVYIIIARGSVYNGFWFVAYGIPALCFFEYCLLHVRISKK